MVSEVHPETDRHWIPARGGWRSSWAPSHSNRPAASAVGHIEGHALHAMLPLALGTQVLDAARIASIRRQWEAKGLIARRVGAITCAHST